MSDAKGAEPKVDAAPAASAVPAPKPAELGSTRPASTTAGSGPLRRDSAKAPSPSTSTAAAAAFTARLRAPTLAASGRRLFDIRLRHQRDNANGIGIAAAPSIADLNGDGRIEIVVSTIDHGIDVFRVPRARASRRPWPTGRGSLLRSGAG